MHIDPGIRPRFLEPTSLREPRNREILSSATVVDVREEKKGDPNCVAGLSGALGVKQNQERMAEARCVKPCSSASLLTTTYSLYPPFCVQCRGPFDSFLVSAFNGEVKTTRYFEEQVLRKRP